MNRQLQAAFFTIMLLAFTPFAHASLLGDIAGGVSNAVSGIVNTVSNVVNSAVKFVQNVVNWGNFLNFVNSPAAQQYSPTVQTPNGSSAQQQEQNARNSIGCTGSSCSGVNSQTAQGDSQPTNTYQQTYRTSSYVSAPKLISDEFSEVTIASLEVTTTAPSGKYFSGTYWGVSTHLVNQGNKEGVTDYRFKLECKKQNITGAFTGGYETIKTLDWIPIKDELPPSYDAPISTTFWVEKDPLQYGGHCKFTAELQNNVQYKKVTQQTKTIIDQFFDLVVGWITTTRTEALPPKIEEGVKTGSYLNSDVTITKSVEFDVEPRTPELEGSANIQVFG